MKANTLALFYCISFAYIYLSVKIKSRMYLYSGISLLLMTLAFTPTKQEINALINTLDLDLDPNKAILWQVLLAFVVCLVTVGYLSTVEERDGRIKYWDDFALLSIPTRSNILFWAAIVLFTLTFMWARG